MTNKSPRSAATGGIVSMGFLCFGLIGLAAGQGPVSWLFVAIGAYMLYRLFEDFKD